MADRKNKIVLKFETDITGVQESGRKVERILTQQIDKTEQQTEATKKSLSIEQLITIERDKQKAAYDRLNASLARINAAPRLNDKLAVNAAAASVRVYNKLLDETQKKLIQLTGARAGASFIAGKETSKRTQKASSGYSFAAQGTVTENRAAKEKANFELVENLRKQYAEKQRVREQAELAHIEQLAARRLAIVQNQVQNEQLFEEAARNRRLAALREDITRRNALRQQEIARQSQLFNLSVDKRASKLQYAVEREIAIERSGINSIQVARVDAAEKTRILQEKLNRFIASQQRKVAAGTITASQATDRVVQAQKRYKNAVLEATKALNEQEKAHTQSIKTQRNLFVRIGEIVGIYQLYVLSLSAIKQAIRNIPTAGLQQQAAQAPIFAIFGSEQGQRNLDFISEVADRAGQSLTALEQSYARYASSAILAGATQEEVNKSFKDFAEVATVLKLSKDKVDSVFLALDQIFAKGVVQSEEIKKQLGNVLPGAVEIGAKAMEKTPAAFIAAMQRNEVTAKEFVPKFAKLYREIFGGVDDKVFNLVSTRLLSNLQRIENEYVQINRAIFESSKNTLNKIVKVSAEALTTIRNNLTGIGQIIEIISALLLIRFSAALATTLAGLTAIGSKVDKFAIALTGLNVAALSAVSGVIYLAGSLTGLSLQYDSATGFTVTFRDKQVSLTSYLKATAIVAIDNLSNAYEKLEKRLKKLGDIDLKSIFENIIPNKKDLDEARAFFEAVSFAEDFAPRRRGQKTNIVSFKQRYEDALKRIQSEQTVQSEILTKALALDVEKTLEDLNGRTTQAVIKAIAQGKLSNYKDITRALNAVNDIQPLEGFGNIEDIALKSRELRNAYKDIERDTKNYTKLIANELNDITYAYRNNIIGIDEYYKTKAQLQDKDITKQFENSEKIRQIALRNKDTAKLEEIDDKVKELIITGNKLQTQTQQERIDALFTYADTQRSVEEEYLRLLGKRQQADELSIRSSFNKNRQTAYANNNTALLKQIDLLEEAAIATSKVNDLEKNRSLKNNDIQRQEAEINQQVRLGLISRIDGAREINALHHQRYLDYEEEINFLEKIKQQNKDNLDLVEEINQKIAQRKEVRANQIPTTDNSQFTGDFSFLNAFADYKVKSEELNNLRKENSEKYADLEKQNLLAPYADAIGTHGEYLENKKALDTQYFQITNTSYAGLFQGISSLGSNTFASLAASARQMYGAQSKEAKRAFLAYKAFKIAEIGIQIATNIVAAFGSGAAIPIGGIAAGPAFAAVAAALGAVQLAAVIAQQPPAAHGGLNYVPKEQTYLLNKGERVLSPNQNRDFTKFINNNTINNIGQKPEVNVKNINIYDPSVVGDYFSTSEGEELFVNLLRRNEATA